MPRSPRHPENLLDLVLPTCQDSGGLGSPGVALPPRSLEGYDPSPGTDEWAKLGKGVADVRNSSSEEHIEGTQLLPPRNECFHSFGKNWHRAEFEDPRHMFKKYTFLVATLYECYWLSGCQDFQHNTRQSGAGTNIHPFLSIIRSNQKHRSETCCDMLPENGVRIVS